jgi:RNA polymerase sigma-70 factor (ECF subfamily)
MRSSGVALEASRAVLEDQADEVLLALLKSRNSGAFEELYRRHAPSVNAATRRLFRDPDLASEATQSAFMRLWERPNDDGLIRLRPWLVRVAHNAAVDRLRRKRLHVASLDEAPDKADESCLPDEEVIMKEQKRDVRAALQALPDGQRDVIELSYFGGLSQGDISELVDIPLGTVKSRIRLGMQRLRTLLVTGETA